MEERYEPIVTRRGGSFSKLFSCRPVTVTFDTMVAEGMKVDALNALLKGHV